MKHLSKLIFATTFLLMPILGANAAIPRICDASFGNPDRNLPRFCQKFTAPKVLTPQKRIIRPSTNITRVYTQLKPNYTTYRNPYSTQNAPTQRILTKLTSERSQTLETISTQPLKVMTLHVTHTYTNFHNGFQGAAKAWEVKVKLLPQNQSIFGGTADFTDFVLYHRGVASRFNTNGEAIINLGGIRLLPGESIEIPMHVGLRAQQNLPQYSGGFQLEVQDIQMAEENTKKPITVSIPSQNISAPFAFGTISSQLQSGTTVQVRVLKENAPTLTAGSWVSLAPVRITPEFADVHLESLRIRNTSGGIWASELFQGVRIVNATTNQTLDTATFNGNIATFNFSSQEANFGIGSTSELRIEGLLHDEIPAGATFQLAFTENDLQFESLTSGSDINSSQISLNVQENTFNLASGTLHFQFSNQQIARPAVAPRPSGMILFNITNAGPEDIELARFNMQIIPQGVNFYNGLDNTDFEIYEVQGFERYQTNFNANVVDYSLAEVEFTTQSPLFIAAGTTRTFEVATALERNGSNNGDEIIFAFTEDQSSNSANLSTLLSNANTPVWKIDETGQQWQSGNILEMPNSSFVVDLD